MANVREDPIVIDLNPKERRLYDRLRASVAQQRPGEVSGWRDVVLLLPDLSILLVRLLRDPRVPLGGKVIALLGLGYVASPIDLLPEVLLGPLGFLDDLVVVAAALSRILNYVHPDVVRAHWSGQGDALAAIQRVSEWSESTISERVPLGVRRLLGKLWNR
jgi:uncharacterized membrane protein YkvA (DUF1232 family)